MVRLKVQSASMECGADSDMMQDIGILSYSADSQDQRVWGFCGPVEQLVAYRGVQGTAVPDGAALIRSAQVPRS